MYIFIRVIFLLEGFSVTGAKEEFNISLCKSRDSHWRNNQYNYLFSGFLDDKVNSDMIINKLNVNKIHRRSENLIQDPTNREVSKHSLVSYIN